MNAAAAAARTGYPAGMPWGYNPYLFGYGNPDVASAYPGSPGSLVGANALGASGGYSNMATEGRREGGSAAASLPAAKKAASAPLESGGETSFLLPAADADGKNDDEDEAGCSQQ